MLLMEQVYRKLRAEELISTAEDFSMNWCNCSRSWFAVQRNSKSDFSVKTAIDCLRHAQAKLAITHVRKKRVGSIVDSEIVALREVISSLEEYLREQHSILAVVTESVPKPKML